MANTVPEYVTCQGDTTSSHCETLKNHSYVVREVTRGTQVRKLTNPIRSPTAPTGVELISDAMRLPSHPRSVMRTDVVKIETDL